MIVEITSAVVRKFFYFEEINSETIDSLIEFIQTTPPNFLIDSIKIGLNKENKPNSFSIGINMTGVVKKFDFIPKKYYYFKEDYFLSINKLEEYIL